MGKTDGLRDPKLNGQRIIAATRLARNEARVERSIKAVLAKQKAKVLATLKAQHLTAAAPPDPFDINASANISSTIVGPKKRPRRCENTPRHGQHLWRMSTMAKRTCSIGGCEKAHKSHGWCDMHYRRWWLYGDPMYVAKRATPLERYMSQVDRSGGMEACWPYTGHINENGYGRIRVGKNPGKLLYAHRFGYISLFGPIPDGTPFVCHKCDNPPCQNPTHWFLGTNAENMADMKAKGRSNRRPRPYHQGEKHPSVKLTEDQVSAIRAERASGRLLREIAADYKIDLSTVSLIALRKLWSHVE